MRKIYVSPMFLFLCKTEREDNLCNLEIDCVVTLFNCGDAENIWLHYCIILYMFLSKAIGQPQSISYCNNSAQCMARYRDWKIATSHKTFSHIARAIRFTSGAKLGRALKRFEKDASITARTASTCGGIVVAYIWCDRSFFVLRLMYVSHPDV